MIVEIQDTHNQHIFLQIKNWHPKYHPQQIPTLISKILITHKYKIYINFEKPYIYVSFLKIEVGF
jgi:hypothetical protein